MSPSSSVGHYRIIAKLGEGGMGTVYRASDTKLDFLAIEAPSVLLIATTCPPLLGVLPLLIDCALTRCRASSRDTLA